MDYLCAICLVTAQPNDIPVLACTVVYGTAVCKDHVMKAFADFIQDANVR